MKRCYYEILEVDKKATAGQIKSSYRKMALKYHPDKNSEDDAKHRFVQINEAYNVLSDPNERTFYDNNREKILFNKDEMSKQDLEQYSFGFNIWGYFTTNCYKGFDDDEGGFYSVYRDVIQKIKAEQVKAYNSREDITEQMRKNQGFGISTTTEEKVLKFYDDWENFTTYKSFVWIEEWDTRDANSRWVRREMEKQNKKQRTTEKKTYIKTIKDLISYIKKRDPRFRDYQMKMKQVQQKKIQQKLEREKEKKKEKEQMKIIKQQMEEERFKQIQEYYRQQNEQATAAQNAHKVHHNAGNEQDKQFYCQICDKGFKSQNQLRNHEKSKQHKQMVKDIEKEVLLKEQIMQRAQQQQVQDVKQQKQQETAQQSSPKKKNKKKKKKNQAQQLDQSEQQKQQKKEPVKAKQPEKKPQPVKKQKSVQKQQAKDSSSDDDDQFMNALLNNRNKKAEKKETKVQSKTTAQIKNDKKKVQAKIAKMEQNSDESQEEDQKIGKAKLKKQKKADQQKPAKAVSNKCNVCNQVFTSKTKLFQHINKTGHASTK